jgi:hypothetical protein
MSVLIIVAAMRVDYRRTTLDKPPRTSRTTHRTRPTSDQEADPKQVQGALKSGVIWLIGRPRVVGVPVALAPMAARGDRSVGPVGSAGSPESRW